MNGILGSKVGSVQEESLYISDDDSEVSDENITKKPLLLWDVDKSVVQKCANVHNLFLNYFHQCREKVYAEKCPKPVDNTSCSFMAKLICCVL